MNLIVHVLLLVSLGVALSQEINYEPIGCFKDEQQDRALPILVGNFRGDIDWHDLSKVVKMCAAAVSQRGYDIFAIQFYGECWSGPNAGLTYNKYGPTPEGCLDNTVGQQHTNMVYRLEALP